MSRKIFESAKNLNDAGINGVDRVFGRPARAGFKPQLAVEHLAEGAKVRRSGRTN